MYLKIAVFSIFLFVLQHIVQIIYSLGYHLHYYQHYPGPCHQLDGVDFGSANFHTLPSGLTLVTSGVTMNIFSGSFFSNYERSGAKGAVFMVNLQNGTGHVDELIIESDSGSLVMDTFRPHGISVWTDEETGQHTVYIVNHPPRQADRVEKFLLDTERKVLQHTQSYTSSKLRVVYDVQALGADAFYATNALFEQRSRLVMLLELFSLMPWSSVVLYEGGVGYRDVVTGLSSATGIVMSQCGRFVYVMLCLGSETRVYRRQEMDNTLTLQQSFQLHTHPDSAVLDPNTGDLFIGAHPVAFLFLKHMNQPWKYRAPSQVLHLRVTEGNITAVTELLLDDGTLISGSTAAVVFHKTLLIGSFVDKLVLCKVNVPI